MKSERDLIPNIFHADLEFVYQKLLKKKTLEWFIFLKKEGYIRYNYTNVVVRKDGKK